MSLPETCRGCGAEAGEGEEWNRAFVHYVADPNDAQAETEWAEEITDTLHAFVCTECGFLLGVIDKNQLDDEGPCRSAAYRVDEELE